MIDPARMSRHPISDLALSARETLDVAGHLPVPAAHAAPDVASYIQRSRGDLHGDRLIGQAIGILMERFEIGRRPSAVLPTADGGDRPPRAS
jgi:hypothetical protein